ncbi:MULTISPECIES: DUF397 domain-containing protein [Streptomyces]|uniref:DUF397 domain-containing protein n=1 Tax=Streptomyces TaxID=1883 RepID=UPI0004CD6F6E|nr:MULTISPECIES: DUF397 domain-containing protein [Streptomyces]KOT62040.1 hypothetical protein ADK43_10840 [Streptomyces rimosus subsp. rimosus]
MSQLAWQKSSYSTHAQDDCLEVAAPRVGPVLYRESDRPGAVGRATAPSWAAFLRAVKADRCADERG